MDTAQIKMIKMLPEGTCSTLSPKQFVNIEFKNVTYKIPIENKKEKIILNDISGQFGAGELTAIIGQSGSGKTTLLNVLAGYRCQETSGAILINNQPKNLEKFTNISRYIMQECVFSIAFSVEETMTFAARLKLGKTSADSMVTIINEILIKLRLEATRQTLVNNLSGGEKRRLSIALELINNPSVLFLDEPTTGLDYSASVQCVRLLRDLANTGRTVICSLHTPSAQMLSLCDNVFVVTSGQCAFQGNVENIVPFLATMNLICPINYDPADFIIEICCGAYGDQKDNLVEKIGNGKIDMKTTAVNNKLIFDQTRIHSNQNCGTNWLEQFRILSQRILMQTCRDKTLLILKFAGIILSGLTFGLMLLNKGQDGTYTQFIVIFFLAPVSLMIYFHAVITIFLFSVEWNSLKREHFNRWYSLSAYYCASFITKLPFHLLFGTILVAIFYTLINFPMELNRFVGLIAVLVTTGLVSESFGEICAILFKPLQALTAFMTVTFFLVSMVLQELAYLQEPPAFIKFVNIFNYLVYSYKGVRSVLFHGRKRLQCSEFCYFSDLDEVLQKFGTGHVIWWVDIIAMAILLIIFKFMGYYLIRMRFTKRNNSIKSVNKITFKKLFNCQKDTKCKTIKT